MGASVAETLSPAGGYAIDGRTPTRGHMEVFPLDWAPDCSYFQVLLGLTGHSPNHTVSQLRRPAPPHTVQPRSVLHSYNSPPQPDLWFGPVRLEFLLWISLS
jgi:hypothetical protein